MFDKDKALQAARRKLANQKRTLQETLDQIDYIVTTKPELANAIGLLKVKRDRQALAIRATEELITIYSEPPKKR